MIYTVTFNPSLDYIVHLPRFVPGAVNRSENESVLPGGKGLNVAVVLGNLGLASRALGFVAGFTGAEIEQELRRRGCNSEFIRLETGLSRINVKIKAAEGESEINGAGPAIDAAALAALNRQLDTLKEGDTLVLAGSIPASMPADSYEKILAALDGRGIRFVVDATGALLQKILKYRPFLIKPNNFELGELVGRDLSGRDTEAIYAAAAELQAQGARNVLVSMAGDGALLLTEDGQRLARRPPHGKVVNSVGAGDSMVAGFVAGFETTGSYAQALRLGTACGSATAFTEWLAAKPQIDALLRAMQD